MRVLQAVSPVLQHARLPHEVVGPARMHLLKHFRLWILLCLQATLRPVACSSPQPADQPCTTSNDSSRQRTHDPLLRSVTAAGITGLHAEPSTVSTAGKGYRPGLDCQPSSASLCSAAGYNSRAAAAYGALRGEASSCLSAEASRLSAVGAAVLLGQPADAPKRSAALPAARRMLLERQVG
jgi:hypothetical protein